MLSWLISDPLEAGSEAPDFSLPDDQGNIVSLRSLRGRTVVLVWYPGDDTSVCRKQLCELRDEWTELNKQGIAVYGVNPQSAESHTKFRAKFNFPFPLLVDQGQKVGKLYRGNHGGAGGVGMSGSIMVQHSDDYIHADDFEQRLVPDFSPGL